MTLRDLGTGSSGRITAMLAPFLSMALALRRRLQGRKTGRVIKALACVLSAAIAMLFLAHRYGPQHIIAAAGSEHPWYLLDALVLGALIQAVRAQRSRLLLSSPESISLSHSYSAMVVGHGIGDLVPAAPGGPVLRSVLVQRLTGIPIPFSGAAFMVEGALDLIAPALLVPYVFFALSLSSWARWVLLGIGIQALTLLVVLAAIGTCHRTRARRLTLPILGNRFMTPARQAAGGLQALTGGGPGKSVSIAGLSVLLLGITAAQLLLFLHAFALGGSMAGLLFLLVVMLSAGSMPLKIPALGTMSAAAALPVAGIHGPAVGGYLLVSQFLLSSQTALLALLVLGWWFVRGIRPARGIATPGRLPLARVLTGTRPATQASAG